MRYVNICVFTRVWLFATPWTVAHQTPLSMEFSRQAYGSKLPFPFQGIFPNQGLNWCSLVSPTLANRFFTNWATQEGPHVNTWKSCSSTGQCMMGFPGSSEGKESSCNVGDLSSIPRLGWSPGGRHGSPFQYSCLENPHGQSSRVGYSPWDHRESDTTEQLSTQCMMLQNHAWARNPFKV